MNFDQLTVMADFCSSGIWIRNDSCMVDFEDLNLPVELVKEFEEWIIFYDDKCHTPRHFAFKGEMADELNSRGRELAKKLKKALPSVRIFFRGEVDGDMLDHEEITGE